MSIDIEDKMLKCDNLQVPFLGEGDIPKEEEKDDAMDVEQAGASAGGAASTVGGQAGGESTGGADDPPATAIEALTSMGFTREQAVTALKRY